MPVLHRSFCGRDPMNAAEEQHADPQIADGSIALSRIHPNIRLISSPLTVAAEILLSFEIISTPPVP